MITMSVLILLLYKYAEGEHDDSVSSKHPSQITFRRYFSKICSRFNSTFTC